MDELIKALTQLAKEATVYLARKNHPELPLAVSIPEGGDIKLGIAETAEDKPAARTRKPRAAKVTAPVDVPPAAAPAAEMPSRFDTMTDAEIIAAAEEAGRKMVMKFNKPGANGPSGQPMPEGYHMVKKILADTFKVVKVAELTIPQRIQYVQIVEAALLHDAVLDGAATQMAKTIRAAQVESGMVTGTKSAMEVGLGV